MEEIFEIIARRRGHLSKAQKKLADYILNNRTAVPFLNISSLARSAGASEATVVRFCNGLGFKGYPDFRQAMQEAVERQLSIRERLRISENAYTDKSPDFLARIFEDDISNIRATLETLNMNTFFDAMDALISAKSVVISANRSAVALGLFLEYYLRLILGNVVLLSNTHVSMEDEVLSEFGKDTVVIGITFHRYTKNTIRLLEYAYNQGCTTIAITDTLQSPAVPFASYAMFAETRLPSLMETFSGPLSIINAIIIYLGRVRSQELDDRLKKMENYWTDFDVFDE